NEAVSSLVYASARCPGLPELRVIRELFHERYGREFVISAVELLPGNLVNQQVKKS
ncbi:Vacuolar protein sorting-associated protein, partial [Trema orientale]